MHSLCGQSVLSDSTVDSDCFVNLEYNFWNDLCIDMFFLTLNLIFGNFERK